MQHLGILHCLASFSLPYKYSSNRSDQSDGPSSSGMRRYQETTKFSPPGSDASIVIRTLVFASRSIRSSGRNTSPSTVAVIAVPNFFPRNIGSVRYYFNHVSRLNALGEVFFVYIETLL